VKLHSIHQVSPRHADETVFKYSALGSLFFVIVCAGITAGCFWLAELGGYHEHGWSLPPFILYWVGGVVGVMALIGQWYFRKRLRPSNWLVKTRTNSLLIKFRSYLNDRFLEADPVVVEIPWSEIQWIRKTTETMTSPSRGSNTASTTSFHTYLDLKLNAPEIEELKQALDTETNRKAPLSEKVRLKRELFRARKRKAPRPEILRLKQEIRSDRLRHQPGQSGATHRHYPVRVIEPSILRIEWNGITPRIKKALGLFSQRAAVEPTLKLRPQDWQSLQGQDLDDRILDLAQRGDTLGAVKLVRRKYGLALGESKQFVEDLLSS
jgi:hypothetical protein